MTYRAVQERQFYAEQRKKKRLVHEDSEISKVISYLVR